MSQLKSFSSPVTLTLTIPPHNLTFCRLWNSSPFRGHSLAHKSLANFLVNFLFCSLIEALRG